MCCMNTDVKLHKTFPRNRVYFKTYLMRIVIIKDTDLVGLYTKCSCKPEEPTHTILTNSFKEYQKLLASLSNNY